MKVIDAAALDYKTLNEVLRQPEHDYVIEGCCGQRFIGAGMSDRNITVNGISGNALGAYLNNASITVNANAQDAVGDTMNAGKILIHGSAGDAAGYAMRGGKIYADIASFEDLQGIMDDLKEYCSDFHYDLKTILSSPFTLVTPNSKNPYKQMYVAN